MRVIEKAVYQFDELSDDAKEKSREWFRQFVFSDSCDWDYIYSDANECGRLIGIEIGRRTFRTMGGGTGSEPEIFFSGFSSQGDGASFHGSYSYAKGGAKAIRNHAPQDAELHRIADRLQAIQSRYFYRLSASIGSGPGSNFYSHSGTMSVDVDSGDDYRTVDDADESDIRELMRDFADWIYSQLQKEYEYQTSDESVDESIRANGYEFDEDGRRD